MYYRIKSDSENYANLLPTNNSIELGETFDGRSHIENWKGLHFDLTLKDDTRPIPEISIDYIPICSRRVYEAIKEICCGFVEFLPCTVGEENLEYYVFNVLGRQDLIDYERSRYQRFVSSGRIMFFNKIVFKEEIKNPLFGISDLPYAFLFCTEEFKALLEGIDVKGVMFSKELF